MYWMKEQWLHYHKLDFQKLPLRVGLFELNFFMEMWDSDLWNCNYPGTLWEVKKAQGPQPNPIFARTSTGLDIFRTIDKKEIRYWFRFRDNYNCRTRQISIAMGKKTGIISVRYGIDENLKESCQDVIVLIVLSPQGRLLDYSVYIEKLSLLNMEKYSGHYTREFNNRHRLEYLQSKVFNLVTNLRYSVDKVLGKEKEMEKFEPVSPFIRYGLVLMTAVLWGMCFISYTDGNQFLMSMFGSIGAIFTIASVMIEFISNMQQLEQE